jgi:hypothetical protein
MADGFIAKTAGLRTGDGGPPASGQGQQPEEEILLQSRCRSRDCRSPTQLFIVAGETERSHRIPVYQP